MPYKRINVSFTKEEFEALQEISWIFGGNYAGTVRSVFKQAMPDLLKIARLHKKISETEGVDPQDFDDELAYRESILLKALDEVRQRELMLPPSDRGTVS